MREPPSKTSEPRPSRPKPSTAPASATDRHQRIEARVASEIAQRLAEPVAPGLHLVATPIGNLGDVTLRALAVIANANEAYCEDTRQSLKLLARFGIERRLRTYHEHNAERERPAILERLAAGASVALMSDAGTPLVCDPGYKLVRAAIEAGHNVAAVPGASAVLTALTAAGLPTDSFLFAGFLPAKASARRRRIAELAVSTSTIVAFETAPRLAEALADLAEILQARPVAIARELTKLHESIRRGSLAELAQWAAGEPVKGEIAIVIGPAHQAQASEAEIRSALTAELRQSSVRDAAVLVATRLGVSRSRVYDLAVQINRASRDDPTE
jgi:16S rRNA (cytidine1402-2'-O)-methyltransferase